MNNELISVIVTIYNIEAYLARCIDSILKQSYRNLEVILVDDGSSDGSGSICDAYEKQDSRIKVIHKRNSGVADARNAGLKAADGEYIGFVDGDDWIHPDMYRDMYHACKKYQAQIAVCRYHQVGEGGENKPFSGKITALDRKEALKSYVSGDETYQISQSVWSKVFSRESVHNLQFASGRLSEDIMFTTQALSQIDRCVYLDTPYYYYTIDRRGSIMNEKLGERRFNHEIPFWREQAEWFLDMGMPHLSEQSRYQFYRKMLFYYIDFKENGSRLYARRMIRMLRSEKKEILDLYQKDFIKNGDRHRMRLMLGAPGLYYMTVRLYDAVIIPLRMRLKEKKGTKH